MSTLRDRFEEKIRRKQLEIRHHENKIREAKIYLQALQDSIRLLPQEGDMADDLMIEPSETVLTLRPKSNVAQTYQLLKKTGEPLYIDDILVGIGKEKSKKERASLAGSLSAYVKRKQIFARTAPNTFGLIGMANQEAEEEEPPEGFGMDHEVEKKETSLVFPDDNEN
jgi:hypothetical protein